MTRFQPITQPTDIDQLLALSDTDLAQATSNLDVAQTRIGLRMLLGAGLKSLVMGSPIAQEELAGSLCDNDAPETQFAPLLA